MNKNISLTASVVTYNSGKMAENLIGILLRDTVKYPLKIFCTDNCSRDNTPDNLKGYAVNLALNTKNLGFAKGHNRILNEDLGDYIFIINPDISFSGDLLSRIADFMEENPNIVLLNPKILNPDGTRQMLPIKKPTAKRLFGGRISKKIRNEYCNAQGSFDTVTDVDFCSGCFMCIRSDAFKKLGGFDTDFFMYLEDADLTLRAKKYGRTVIAPQFSVYHNWERGSRKSLPLMLIHIISAIKFLLKGRG